MVKTSELIGAALDWAVAKCGEWDGNTDADLRGYVRGTEGWTYTPSTDWAQGGPIVECEGIALHRGQDDVWWARIPSENFKPQILMSAPTPLIAAMRCYVASKLGDEVEVPDELMESA